MMFPERNFLPFARSCSQEIKKHLKPSKYHVLEHELVLVSVIVLCTCQHSLNIVLQSLRLQNERFWAMMTYSMHLECLLGIIKPAEWMTVTSGFCSRRYLHV